MKENSSGSLGGPNSRRIVLCVISKTYHLLFSIESSNNVKGISSQYPF